MEHHHYRLRTFLSDPSGGLLYHWRAVSHRKRLWQPFLRCVEGWLKTWCPPERELVLIGPSSGYSFPRWFGAWASERFDRVVALEPDLLARRVLRWRVRPLRVDFGELDCFAGLKGPEHLARAHPGAAFLFCNVIGQLLEHSGGMAWRRALIRAMRGRSWASYHDVVSTRVCPREYTPHGLVLEGELETVMARFWPGGELPLHDHETFRLAAHAEYAVWSITPEQHHLLEWVRATSSPSSNAGGNTGMGGKS